MLAIHFLFMSLQHRKIFNYLDRKGVLTHDYEANGVSNIQSSTLYKFSGLGCFAVNCFGVGQVIGIYCRSLVRTNSSEKNTTTKTYEEGIMGVTNETFQKMEIKFLDQGTCSNCKCYTV